MLDPTTPDGEKRIVDCWTTDFGRDTKLARHLFVIHWLICLWNWILHIQIALVEMVQPHVPVFCSARIIHSIWIDRNCIDRTEMPFDASKFFFVDEMEKTRLEFADLSRCRRDGHGFLSSTKQDVIFLLAYDSIVDRAISLVCFEVLQIDSIVQFGCEIGGGCDEKRFVKIELQAVDLLFMRHELIDDPPSFRIIKTDVTIVHADEQMLVEVRPRDVGCVRSLDLLGDVDFLDGFHGIGLDVEDADFCIVVNERVGNGRKTTIVFCPSDTTNWPTMREVLQAFTSFATPHLARSVRACCEQVLAEAVAIQIPNRSLVPVESP